MPIKKVNIKVTLVAPYYNGVAVSDYFYQIDIQGEIIKYMNVGITLDIRVY